MKDSPVTNVERLGYLIRMKRQEKHLSQAALATHLGVERKWVLKLEAGNRGAELGLVLKALAFLGLHMSLSEQAPTTPPSELDEVFRRLQRTSD
jgi:transcriptional regulator with XRE-family HTH domain